MEAPYSPQVHDLIGDARLPYLHAATMNHAVERVRDSRLRLGNIFQSCASDINYVQGLFVGSPERWWHHLPARRRYSSTRPWPSPREAPTTNALNFLPFVLTR